MKAFNATNLGTTRAWWVILLVGLFMVMGGFAYWFWPEAGYAVASQIFGWLLILAGAVQLSVSASGKTHGTWGWWLAGGVIDIFIGFVLVRNVFLSEMVFPYFLAFLFLFWGVEALVDACTAGSRARYRWLGVVNGVLLCLIGFFFMEAGWVSNMFMVSFLVSIAFIYWGFTIAISAYELRPTAIEK
ncbi:MAG: DUF308 domain-containing protein [Muribaculaceae bacterium]|nr:DUF308 domain-containing protein [Muribaculaceae bacterium]